MFALLAFSVSIATTPLPVSEANELGRRSIKVLSELMSSVDPEVRSLAAAAWGEIGNKAAKGGLKRALKDKHPVVRIEAAFSLHKLGDDKGLAALESIVLVSSRPVDQVLTSTLPASSPDEDVREIAFTRIRVLAVERLGQIGGVRAVEILEKVVDDPSNMVRDACAVALARLGFDELDPVFIETLQDKRETVRAASAKALGMLGRPVGIDELRAAAEDTSYAVRVEAVKALGNWPDEGIFDILSNGVKDKNSLVQAAAVESLGKMRTDASKRILLEIAVSTSSPVLALKAQVSLASRGEPIDLALVSRVLRQGDSDLMGDAIAILKASRDHAATALLRDVLDADNAQRVRLQAATALVKRLQKPPEP